MVNDKYQEYNMNRRKLLGYTAPLFCLLALRRISLLSVATISPTEDSLFIIANSIQIVGENQKLSLPENAKEGDTILLSIPAKSATRPSQINYGTVPIAGDRDHLILDSISNIKLTYKGQTSGWTLS
jgi:hypothetical protein